MKKIIYDKGQNPRRDLQISAGKFFSAGKVKNTRGDFPHAENFPAEIFEKSKDKLTCTW